MAWRKAYRRPTVDELEALRPELLEDMEDARRFPDRRTGVGRIGVRENIEQGLLMILGSSLWDAGFRELYEKNTDTGLYEHWAEYKDGSNY